jgi:uncharacterized lipoprotein YddW (UPF0748 family)
MQFQKIILTVIATCLFISIKAQKNKQHEYIRGTWITNVASKVLTSKENIKKAVRQCKENGLNHLFVVVWNNGKTMYPSSVAEKYIGLKQDPVYKGRDPIREIIAEAHKYTPGLNLVFLMPIKIQVPFG